MTITETVVLGFALAALTISILVAVWPLFRPSKTHKTHSYTISPEAMRRIMERKGARR